MIPFTSLVSCVSCAVCVIMRTFLQLKKWQQHMHEQLKAHQLEELLCLQEQQHRLLGVGVVPRICTEGQEKKLLKLLLMGFF